MQNYSKVLVGIILVFGFVLSGCKQVNNPGDDKTYLVKIGTVTNGTISANPTSGAEGTEITLTVSPDDGYRLKIGTLKYGTTLINENTKKFNLPASNITVTAKFRILADDDSEDESGLSIIKIDTGGRAIDSKDTWLENAAYTIFNSDGTTITASGATDIKGRGNFTWGLEKKPYSLKLSSKTSLLGMPSHKRWVLLANHLDKTLLRNEIGFKLGEIFDHIDWTPHTVQVELYVNDVYQGVYQFSEAIKLDANRVAIDEIKKGNPGGGYILEIDERRGEESNFTTTHGVVFNCSDPDDGLDKKPTGSPQTLFEKIRADVQHAEDVLYSGDFTDPDNGYRKYLDVDSFVDWYLVEEIACYQDSKFYSSVYMYYDPSDQKYHLGPLWDFDTHFGNAWSMVSTGFLIKDSKWISRLFDDPYFVSLIKARWNEKKSAVDALQTFIDARADSLNAAQANNFERWPILNTNIGGANSQIAGSYAGEIAFLKLWLTLRISWLDTAINRL
ncbi:CotH protein [Treponema primitia ZAS-2]|uniref:CotH protein n=1 Tax=Treponema primitia (strain ATCC BAA-887 / DSM 12427 / ZAS-2) TaxID=545694 RepID=F5YQF9_TREPZ|nr:CotH kinase family protein [Treponema primitia]AEF85770.1 CotH protein [Treponema primitia ZAS-2]